MRKILLVLIVLCAFNEIHGQTKKQADIGVSEIKWSGSNFLNVGGHYGIVKLKSGVLYFKDNSLQSGVFLIDMTTIANTDGKYNEGLVGHLKNEDFFEVEKFPIAILKIKEVKYLTDSTISISSDLTIKGIKNSVMFKASYKLIGGKITYIAKFAIDRTQWQIRYKSKNFFSVGDDFISDIIGFEVKIVAPMEKD